MTAAVGYLRVSTEEQNGPGTFSMERQRTTIEQRASRDKCEVVRWFQDVDSGEKLSREGYQAMLTFLRRKEAVRVYIWESSRLGRNDREFLRCCWELEDLGIDVVSCTQDLQNVLLRYIYAWKGQEDNRELGRRVSAGKKTASLKFRWQGNVPYGYRRDPETLRLVVYEEEAAIVRWLYASYLEGVSFSHLARELNRRQVKPYRTPDWRPSTIAKMMRRPVYLGRMVNKHVDNGVTHEPLVSQEAFDKVKEIRAGLTTGGRGSWQGFLLTGLIKCGYCGAPMNGQRGHGGRYKQKDSYHCTRHAHLRDCRYNSLQCEVLDARVVGDVRKLINPDVFDEVRLRQTRAQLAELSPQIKALTRQVAECDSGIQRAWDLVLSETVTAQEFKEQKERLTAKKESLGQQLLELEQQRHQVEEQERRSAQLGLALRTFDDRWEQGTIKERNLLLKALVLKVIVKRYDNEVEVRFRF